MSTHIHKCINGKGSMVRITERKLETDLHEFLNSTTTYEPMSKIFTSWPVLISLMSGKQKTHKEPVKKMKYMWIEFEN